MKKFAFTLTLSLCLLCCGAYAQRVALVIGNAAYQHETPAKNPVHNARLLAEVLKKDLKFDDVELLNNANQRQLFKAVARFAPKVRGADVAVVYYAGLCMRDQRLRNYLLPVDAIIEKEDDLMPEALLAEELVKAVSPAGVKIVILDTVCDVPHRFGRSFHPGLGRMDANIDGLLIAFASRKGDKIGDDGLYARSLAVSLARRDQSILAVFDMAASSVCRATNGLQCPTHYGNLPVTAYLLPLGSDRKTAQDESEQQGAEGEVNVADQLRLENTQ